MTQYLTDTQLDTLLRSTPQLEKIEPLLAAELQQRLSDLQRRAGDTYASGVWTVPTTGEQMETPACQNPPTVDETQAILGQAYLTLKGDKDTLRQLMEALGITLQRPGVETGLSR